LLRSQLRERAGRHKHPTTACLESQSVKCSAVLGKRGYDAEKQVNGRKRHILVDTMGWLLAVVVTVASVQGRDSARLLLGNLPGGCKKLRKVWVDGGYSGSLLEWVAERFKLCLAVVLRPKESRKFVLLLRRWVVERTFVWLNHSRRLSKSYEHLTRTDEAWIYIAMTRIMLQRLA
jgi:putative transposase